MMANNEINLFESQDGEVVLEVNTDFGHDEVWLNRAQISQLYGRDVKTIGKHISNALNEELSDVSKRTVAKFATVQTEGNRQVKREIEHYGLDVVLSVGYRVKSQRGTEFRRWVNNVMHQYIIEGRAENENRLRQLEEITHIIERLPDNLESQQILDIVQSYTGALDLLDDYDHQRIKQPKGSKSTYQLTYEECKRVIESMRFGKESSLFGVEKDDSFKGCIGNVYQTFDGQDIYPTREEKAANLLYFLVKDHPFLDGNKRIAAALFLYFLDRNKALYRGNEKVINDSTLVAITIMVAESRAEEKDTMVLLLLNFLK